MSTIIEFPRTTAAHAQKVARKFLVTESPLILSEFELVVEYLDQENELVKLQIQLVPLMENPLGRLLSQVVLHTESRERLRKQTTQAFPTTWADSTLPLIPQVVAAMLFDMSCYVFSPVAFVSGKYFTEQQLFACDNGACMTARKGFYK